jgi:hypothetical protein
MKFYTYLISISTLLFFAACKKDSLPLNENYIPVNKCQSYYNDSITCCLDSVVQDSRCPLNAVCIWQGIAVARFKVNTSNEAHSITLATWKFQSYIKDTTVAGFKIELVNINSQNEATKPFGYNDYVAEVKITKL